MKKVIFFLMSLTITITALWGQDRDRDMTRDKDQIRLNDCLIYEDETVFLLTDRDQYRERDMDADQPRDQDRVQLKDQMKLYDGTVVNANGMFTDGNGVQQRLRDGECLDMDGNKYVSHQRFREQLQTRQQAMNQPHYIYQDGKLFQIQNRKRTQVRERLNLGTSAVDPEGNYEVRNQLRTKLQNGECLDTDGNLFASQAQFRKQSQLRLQAMGEEHFVFEKGNMYRVQNQERTRLSAQVTPGTGIAVNPDGSIRLRDQTRIQLRNGECIDAEGNLYESQQQFRQQAQVRLMAMNQEHFVFRNGALYQMQNQERFRVREQLKLHDGSTVFADGTVRDKNNQQSRLRDGECLDVDGNRYASQEQYHQATQNRFMAMSEPHFFYQNGKVYRVLNQNRLELKERWSFMNGLTINPDGTYRIKNRKTERMRDGEYMDWEGRRYDNQDRFRERMQERMQDRIEMRERDRTERRSMNESRKRMGS